MFFFGVFVFNFFFFFFLNFAYAHTHTGYVFVVVSYKIFFFFFSFFVFIFKDASFLPTFFFFFFLFLFLFPPSFCFHHAFITLPHTSTRHVILPLATPTPRPPSTLDFSQFPTLKCPVRATPISIYYPSNIV